MEDLARNELAFADKIEKILVFEKEGFFDLLLVADGEKIDDFGYIFVAGWAVVEVDSWSVSAGGNVRLFADADEVAKIIAGAVEGFVVPDGHR